MKNKLLLAIILILVVAIGVLSYLNLSETADSKNMIKDASFMIKAEGEEVGVVTFEEIQSLEEKEFSLMHRSSGKPEVEKTYQGVLLKDILQYIDEEIFEGKKQLVARAVDAYVISYNIEEVLEDDNLYVVYTEDGDPLGTKSEGGLGPLMIVVKQDEFAQRWLKFLVEVDLQ